MTTTMQSEPELVTVRPAAVPPSRGWVLKRIALGLAIMIGVTSLATYIASASIEASQDPAPSAISIGAPAAALLKR